MHLIILAVVSFSRLVVAAPPGIHALSSKIVQISPPGTATNDDYPPPESVVRGILVENSDSSPIPPPSQPDDSSNFDSVDAPTSQTTFSDSTSFNSNSGGSYNHRPLSSYGPPPTSGSFGGNTGGGYGAPRNHGYGMPQRSYGNYGNNYGATPFYGMNQQSNFGNFNSDSYNSGGMETYPSFSSHRKSGYGYGEDVKCIPGFTFLEGNCYKKVEKKRVNYEEAIKECKKLHPQAHLPVFTSLKENNAVSEEFDHDFWLNIVRENPDSDKFVNVNANGSEIKFRNFRPFEPDNVNGKETCVLIYGFNGQWNDDQCSTLSPPLCQMQLPQCPPGFEFIYRSCLTQIKQSYNYTLAAEECTKLHKDSHLVIISDEIEHEAILKKFDKFFWVGITKQESDATKFVTINGKEATYFDWDEGEPSDSNERCIEINENGKMDDNLCRRLRFPVCQIEVTFPQATETIASDQPENFPGPTYIPACRSLDDCKCIPGFIFLEGNCHKSNNTPLSIKSLSINDRKSSNIPSHNGNKTIATMSYHQNGKVLFYLAYGENTREGRICLFNSITFEVEIVGKFSIWVNPYKVATGNDQIFLMDGWGKVSEIFNYETKQLTKGSDPPERRSLATVAHYKNKLYYIGGRDSNKRYPNSVNILVNGRWQRGPDFPIKVYLASQVICNDKLYVIPLKAVFQLSDDEREWIEVGKMEKNRYYPAVASLNGKIYITGGFNGGKMLNSCLCFDPSQPFDRRFISIANMNYIRYDHSLVVANGKLYAIGGYQKGGWKEFCIPVEEYDPTTNRWRIVGEIE